MTSERACFVHLAPPGSAEFVVVGRFRVRRTRSGVPRGEFVYGRSWLDRPNAVELDPVELTLGPQARETVRLGGFFGAIRDAMPDAWGRRLLERQLGTSRLDEFDYLRFGDVDRAGALGFAPGPEFPAGSPTFPEIHDLTASPQEPIFPATSLGGARPKVTVEDNGHLWLAKFEAPQDQWNEPRVEHALLRLASRCGFRAAESRIVASGGRSVLLTRRFDRERADSGMLRWRFASGLTLLRAEESATARERWSYLLLADEIRRSSIRPREDLRELFGRICFHAAVRNTDDHPRNHALIADHRGWRLSPAYDLTPSPGPSREAPWLAMDCGIRGRQASRDNLLSGAGRFLLARPEAEAILDAVFRTVGACWRDAMREAGVSLRDEEAIATAFAPPA